MTAAAVMDFVAAAAVLGFVAVVAGVVVITVERVGTWRGTVGAR